MSKESFVKLTVTWQSRPGENKTRRDKSDWGWGKKKKKGGGVSSHLNPESEALADGFL